MSFIKTCLLLLSAALAAHAASIPGGREAWQKLLEMPSFSSGFSAGWSQHDGILLSNDKPDPAVEIPRLRAQLRGTPGDAALYWEMSRIYSRLEDDANESNTVSRAVALFRQQAGVQPENVEVLTRFGLALGADGKSDEAGAVLRRAVRLGPKDWRAWSALSQWHGRESWRSFSGIAPTNGQKFLSFILDQASRRQLPARLLEEAQKSIEEGERCADRAVELAPREPLAYSARVEIRSTKSILRYLAAVTRGADADPYKFQLAIFPPDTIADLWRVAELSPGDPRSLGLAALGQFTISAASLSKADRKSIADGNLPRLIPNEELRRCISALTRLEEIGQTRPPATAALALEIRGMLLFGFLQDSRGAEASLRRATELDPVRETSWDMLIAVFGETDRVAEARTAAEKRLKVKDTARNRVIAAKMCEHLGLMAQAQSHVDVALKLEPDGYLPNLAALVLALMRSKDRESAKLATQFLRKLQALPSETLSDDQKLEASLAAGIGCVLVDEPAMARKYFEHILTGDKDNETAKQALSMLAGK